MSFVSIYTPTHTPLWLQDAYRSLCRQTYKDFEWIIVPNNGCAIPDNIRHASFVKIHDCANTKATVSELKKFAISQSTGELLVELDHDDYLTDNALGRIVEEYRKLNTDKAFLFSDSVSFYDDGNGQCEIHSPDYGWETYPFVHEGIPYTAIKNFPVTARSLCEIFYAPNHVRVWSKGAYESVSGYNPDLLMADDHDLMCRTYIASVPFKHIPECLYMYRVHGSNTCKQKCVEVHKQQEINRDNYLQQLVREWCKRERLTMVDLGSAHNKPNGGYIGIDIERAPGVDIVCDVTKGLPFDNNSVGLVRAYDFIEHMPLGSLPSLFNEIYRVLVPGGWFVSLTPSTDGRGAFQDPTHTSFINSNSFWYYTRSDKAKYVKSIKCRFQAVQVENYVADSVNNIVYVFAALSALKGQRQPGLCLI